MATFRAFFAFFSAASAVALKVSRRASHSETTGICRLHEDVKAELGGKAAPSRCSNFPASTRAGGSGVDYVSFIQNAVPSDQQQVVWVSGYPRSGSSVVLSMVSATVDDNRAPGGETFSIFEPCHDGDQLSIHKSQEGCGSVLWGISRCDFTGIKNLWGWWDPHSTNGYSKFHPKNATKHCQKADTVAFKTVDWGHNLARWKWLVSSHPNMRVLDVVRDPRGIYASWKVLEPFKSLVEAGTFYTLTDICRHYDMNIKFEDERVHRVVFEHLMTDPAQTTEDVYKFLKKDYGLKQKVWINDVFNNTDCPPPPPELEGFTDCHTDSAGVVEKWRSVLSQEEKAEFRNSVACQNVASYYGWKD